MSEADDLMPWLEPAPADPINSVCFEEFQKRQLQAIAQAFGLPCRPGPGFINAGEPLPGFNWRYWSRRGFDR